MSNVNDFRIKNDVYLEKYLGSDSKVIIPEGVKIIGESAFSTLDFFSNSYCGVVNVIIPDGVTEIKENAFNGCRKLQNIIIPDSVTKIGEGAFKDCSNLQRVKIPCNVKKIEKMVFEGCGMLRSLIIPREVSEIADSAIYNCDRLNSIIVDDCNPNYCSVDGVLFDKNKTTVIKYPADKMGDVYAVPDGVTTIANSAFGGCKRLTLIKLPDSVTDIEAWAFKDCSQLANITIPDGVTTIANSAFGGCKRLTLIKLPDSVTDIEAWAFKDCSKLANITIPDGVTNLPFGVFDTCENLTEVTFSENVSSIERWAFRGCERLREFGTVSPHCQIGDEIFGQKFPTGLSDQVEKLWKHFSDSDIKKYFLDKKIWEKLSLELKAEIFLAKQSKPFLKAYIIGSEEAKVIGERLIEILSDKPGAKECTTASNFMTNWFHVTQHGLLRRIYAKLKELKAEKALKAINENVKLMDILGEEMSVDSSLPEAEQKIMNSLKDRRKSPQDIETELKSFYSLKYADLPNLNDKNGIKVAPVVLAYLLMLHEKLQQNAYKGQPDVVRAYDKPGLCPEAYDLVALLDNESMQQAMFQLADNNLGLSGRSKKMFLAYPICRYADEKTMAELTKRAPKWRSHVSGNDAPPLATFRRANRYSETRAAMLFADKYHELHKYAELRGKTEDSIRDRFLSDVGVDENGRKNYDLGNQTVTAILQNDLSFLIELPDGKTAKSLPKKGADETKYNTANADFSEMKKAVKRIIKNRCAILFEDFLGNRGRTAEDWKEAYLFNPVLRMTAKLLVWTQGQTTFTIVDGGAITSDGSHYDITDAPIYLAHPMEMRQGDVDAWQRYFTAHSLKQPFEQIWEPAIDQTTITEDRYAGCLIPYYRFRGQDKHGITVEDYDFHNEIDISFAECDAFVDRIDWRRHEIENDDNFEVKSFKFNRYTRRVNHIVAYLDKVTIIGRIMKDDISIAQFLHRFTLAQIIGFIKVATENNCTNVTAVLLDYQQKHFSDFDPMAEFTLD